MFMSFIIKGGGFFPKLSKMCQLLVIQSVKTRKFYIRRNNNKVDSIEIGRIVIAHLLP